VKVLIVEDDPASRKYLKDTVEAEGHEVKTAENGQTGLNIFKQFKPDLVLSDIQMPVVDGLELLEAIRLQNSDSIVVIMTAFGSEEYAMQAMRLGANNYLKKPTRHAELLPILKKYGSLIEARTYENEVLGMIVEKNYTMKFDNRFEIIPNIVDRLVLETGGILPKDKRFGVGLGLLELLTNAVEHGNLEIGYEEKSAALETDTLESLYKQRQADPLFAQRKVTVAFKMDGKSCEWLITDKGKGFDWKTVMDLFDESKLLEAHGRGIFITKFYFDELIFNDAGNAVRAIRRC